MIHCHSNVKASPLNEEGFLSEFEGNGLPPASSKLHGILVMQEIEHNRGPAHWMQQLLRVQAKIGGFWGEFTPKQLNFSRHNHGQEKSKI